MKTFNLKVNNTLVNTIRRVAFENLPTDAFDPELIVFKKNTTIYHNDYMRKRISNLPVHGLPNTRKRFNDFISANYDFVIKHVIPTKDKKNEVEVDEAIYNNVEVKDFSVEKNDTLVLTMYCNKTHDSKDVDVMNVTTDDCQFTINEKSIPSPYKVPLLLCKLRYKEGIEFSASSRYSIPIESPLWNIVSNCFFVSKGENDFDFRIASKTDVTEEEILQRIKIIILEKLKNISNVVEQNYQSTEEGSGELRIENDKFTLSGLLTHYLQEQDDILYAGYKAEHLLNNTSIIYYRTSSDIRKVLKIILEKISQDLDSTIVTTK